MKANDSKISEYYTIFKDLIKQYYETKQGRKEIYQQINQYHKLIELERIKVLSKNYTNKSEIADWVNIVCQLCREEFDAICKKNKNDLSNAKRIVDRITDIANSYENIYSKKYCIYKTPSLLVKTRKAVFLGTKDQLQALNDSIKDNALILNASGSSFLLLLDSMLDESVIPPLLEPIKTGEGYIIYGKKRNDILGLVIQQVTHYIDANGYDISDVTKRELMGMQPAIKKIGKMTKNS